MDAERATVIVVDDDDSVCRSLSRLLMSAGHEVLAYASATAFLESAQARHGNCLVLDIRLPGMTGLELQQEMQCRNLRIPIVFISGHGDIPMCAQAMKAGAVDFLPKPFDADQLLGSVAQAVARDVRRRVEEIETAAIHQNLARLTAREREVLERIVTGMLNKEVAHELGVAEKTIKVHRARVMDKMGVESLAELVYLAGRVGIGLAHHG